MHEFDSSVGNGLPPLAMLRAFATAGRLESFRDAARELGVTPSAISHQVAALERWVGAPLFERSARQVRLTTIGRALSADLNVAMELTIASLSRARREAADSVLHVSASLLFTNAWLAPRLARFQHDYRDLILQIETTGGSPNFESDKPDVAIHAMLEPPPGIVAHKLLDLRAVPLCAISLAPSVTKPDDLAAATLIEVTSAPVGWRDWLDAHELANLAIRSTLSFDNLPSALEAAAAGLGVVLAACPLALDTPAAAQLVTPLAAAPVSAGSYFVMHRRSDLPRRSVTQFVDWLVAEMKADARRLARLQPQTPPGPRSRAVR